MLLLSQSVLLLYAPSQLCLCNGCSLPSLVHSSLATMCAVLSQRRTSSRGYLPALEISVVVRLSILSLWG